jgi:hypothetical protein
MDASMVEITGNSIDRASERLLDLWKHDCKTNRIGIHAWLLWLAKMAILANHRDHHGQYIFRGIIFVFDEDGHHPVLKTVMKEVQ